MYSCLQPRTGPPRAAAITRSGDRTLGETLARLAHEHDRLGEEHANGVADLRRLLLGLPPRSIRLMLATVICTARLIALSAQPTFWAVCICSAMSCRCFCMSPGSPNIPNGNPPSITLSSSR